MILPCRGREEGFSLVAALFVLVVLALLATIMVTLSGVQARTPLLALQGTRGFQAARSGIEWGVSQVLPPAGVPAPCFAPATFPLAGPGLAGFSVTVTCSETLHTEVTLSPNPYRVYALEAVATTGTYGSGEYISRRMQATVTAAP